MFIQTFLALWRRPKTEELVADRVRHGGKDKAEDFFLTGMGKAIKNMAEQSNKDIPATIYYAFKQSEVEQEGISSTGLGNFSASCHRSWIHHRRNMADADRNGQPNACNWI
jgi:putative DNA methylase